MVSFHFLLSDLHAQTNSSLNADRSLENARATFQDSILTVTTGKVTRQWRLDRCRFSDSQYEKCSDQAKNGAEKSLSIFVTGTFRQKLITTAGQS